MIAIETVDSGVESENPPQDYSGQILLLTPSDGTVYSPGSGFRDPLPGETKDCMATYFNGGPDPCAHEPKFFNWKIGKPKANQVPRKGNLERRIFFASNTGDAEQQGIESGLAIRSGGNTRNSGVFFTMKATSLNFANGY